MAGEVPDSSELGPVKRSLYNSLHLWARCPHLSMSCTRQDLTQGFFIAKVMEWEVTHESICEHYWSVLIIGSLSTMGTLLVIVKSLSTKPGDIISH